MKKNKQNKKQSGRHPAVRFRNARPQKNLKRASKDTPTRFAENAIIRAMAQGGPYTAQELFVQTGMRDKDEFYTTLRWLKEQGRITTDEEKKLHRVPSPDECEAVIVSLSRGFAFARPENGGEDVFIHGSRLNGAMLGDRVLLCDLHDEERGPSGAVAQVLENGPCRVTGTVVREEGFGGLSLLPDSAIRFAVPINPRDLRGAREGDKVLANLITDYRGELQRAEVISVFGSGQSARVCADAVIAQHEIPHVFPEDVLQEGEAAGRRTITDEDCRGRLDLRKKTIFTIDGPDAKDLDDAISVSKTRRGYTLGVHIADVSHYVREHTALDAEAMRRGTSVYFADRVIPMLPEAISNGVCSLNAGTDKLAFSAFIDLDEHGNIVDYTFRKTILRSKVRGVYGEVNRIFDGTADAELRRKYAPVRRALSTARELFHILKEGAVRRGTMELDSAESYFVLDEKGVCVDIRPRQRGEAEEMIEQFMVTANQAAAMLAERENLPFVYRIHGNPAPERVETLCELLDSIGVSCTEIKKPNPTTADFAAVRERVRGTNYDEIVSTQLLRTMDKARYSTEPLGHFGLALSDYCHFTSPIRRYPDTSIHRILTAWCEKKPVSQIQQLYREFSQESAQLSSKNEVRAMTAERDAEDCYMAEYAVQHLGEEHDGIVSGVTQRGVFVRLPNNLEGFVPVASFQKARYEFDGALSQYDTVTGSRLTIGSPLRICIASSQVATGKIDFMPVES